MRKLNIVYALLLLSTTTLFAQEEGGKVDDLTFLYIDGKYSKAVDKGQALMYHDDFKKHPLVYIYTSMSYYEMSRKPGEFSVGEKDSRYPKPIKMAQKYLYKFMKVDKKAPKYYERTWSDEAEFKEYYVKLADTSSKLGQNFYLDDKYRKSASVYKNAFRAVPGDPVLQMWQGIGEIKSKNTTEGKKTLVAAIKKIDENFKPSTATSPVITQGIIISEELLRSLEFIEEADKAKKLIDVFLKYDPVEIKKREDAKKKKKAVKNDPVKRSFASDENDEDNKNKKRKVIIEDSKSSDDEELDQLEKEAEEDN